LNSPTARFLAYAEAYLGAIRMWTPGASSLDPFERLRSLSGDDPISVSVVEIQLSLTADSPLGMSSAPKRAISLAGSRTQPPYTRSG